ncbi:MAG: prolyl oligopeptidase family serine peptidase [Acidobacteriaceae bacterium]|nr:prolyl oligopeptidase family serine peptidase [Acidobacteriaceae bacterium]
MLTESLDDAIHGVRVSDPYRWLEDSLQPETTAWIEAQRTRFEEYFDGKPSLAILTQRVERLLSIDSVDQIVRTRERYIYRKRFAYEEHPSICSRSVSAREDRVLVSSDRHGPSATVAIHALSSDGTKLAYEVSRDGSDLREIHFINVEDGSVLAEHLGAGYCRGIAFGAEGFFYSVEKPTMGGTFDICYRPYGTHGEDQLVYRISSSECLRLVLLSDDQRVGIVVIRGSELDPRIDFLMSTLSPTPLWKDVVLGAKGFAPVLSNGRIFAVVKTTLQSTSLLELSADGEPLREVVPPVPFPIRQLGFTDDEVFVDGTFDGEPCIHSWTLEDRIRTSLPFSKATGLQLLSKYGCKSNSVFYSVQSFSHPPVLFERLHGESKQPLDDTGDLTKSSLSWIVREESCRSKDGTVIPMTIVYCGSGEPLHTRPAILTSYGGFGRATTPKYSVLVHTMVELGVVFAIAHIRGGGEKGKEWHEDGRGRKRQNSFDDFLAVAEWLGKEGICDGHRLAIFGGSNSGLLVAAVMTQRPDLFRAVLCIAPLTDMVRYEQFPRATRWRSEYGSVENRDDFTSLYAFSPYHHVSDLAHYPAVMFVTGEKDDRCDPAHTRKMAAILQERSRSNRPIVVDYGAERGHSATRSRTAKIAALGKRLTFLCHELGICVPERSGDVATSD